MSAPYKVFITYSHQDEEYKNKLIKYLAVMEQNGEIEIWRDDQMLPGDRWEKEIAEHIKGSDILLYLISASSLASKNCNKELTEALSYHAQKIRIIPIILERCDWENHTLSDFQVLPKHGKPLNTWEPESDGWQNIVNGLRRVVEERSHPKGDNRQEIAAQAVFQVGNMSFMLAQFDQAIDMYSLATKLNPNIAEAYNNRGTVHTETKNYKKALEDYDQAIKLQPNYAAAYNNRGTVYSNLKKYKEALKDYNRTIELNPNIAEAYNNRGNVYSDLKNYKEAIEDYDQAIKLQPSYAEAYDNRGNAYNALKKYEEAIKDFSRAIKLQPSYTAAYYNRGVVHFGLREYTEAIKDYSRAIELGLDFGIVYFMRSICRICLKQWPDAQADLLTAQKRGADIVDMFQQAWKSIAAYEKEFHIQLPGDIAKLLKGN